MARWRGDVQNQLCEANDRSTEVISQKAFIKLFYKSQFPHKPVNLSFISTNIKNTLMDWRGDVQNQLCEANDRSTEVQRYLVSRA